MESNQELDVAQLDPLSQLENIDLSTIRNARNELEYVSARNHNLSTPIFHNVEEKIKTKFDFAPFL